MTSGDLAQVLEWRNDPKVRNYMLSRHEISPDDHRKWFEECLKNESRHLLIFECDDESLGFVSFNAPDAGAVSEWGFYAAPAAPRGSGAKLGAAALQYGFNILKLHKICGRTLGSNERSVRFHQRFGFQREGVLREQHFDGERYHDIVCFGLLRAEWAP